MSAWLHGFESEILGSATADVSAPHGMEIARHTVSVNKVKYVHSTVLRKFEHSAISSLLTEHVAHAIRALTVVYFRLWAAANPNSWSVMVILAIE